MAKDGTKTGGRTKGTPNKDTKLARTAFNKLLEDNLDNMKSWLQNVAKENPQKAFELMLQLAEFSIPKLARTEVDHTTQGEKISINILPPGE